MQCVNRVKCQLSDLSSQTFLFIAGNCVVFYTVKYYCFKPNSTDSSAGKVKTSPRLLSTKCSERKQDKKNKTKE